MHLSMKLYLTGMAKPKTYLTNLFFNQFNTTIAL